MVANGPEPSRQPVRKIDLDYWWYGDFLSAVGADIQRLPKMAAAVADSETLVNDMTTDIRTISYLLHPPLLDEAGLASALRWYVEGLTTRSEMRVALEVPDDFDRLPRDLETAIFRVVQDVSRTFIGIQGARPRRFTSVGPPMMFKLKCGIRARA